MPVQASIRSSATSSVLLLEDSEVEASNLLSWLIGSEGDRFEVTHVTTVARAVEELTRGGYDVALIDLCVDDSRGLPTFRSCHVAAPHLPIVVQSALAGDEVALQAVAEGAQDYLVKRLMNGEVVRRALRYAIERGHIQGELSRSQERYRLALDGANDGIWDWDLVAGRLFLSDRWCAMLGYARADLGEDLEDWLGLVHHADRDAIVSALDGHLKGMSEHFEFEHRVLHQDGSWRWMRTRGLAVRGAAGRPTRFAGSQTDITERRLSEERLAHQAFHDSLTDLPNRPLFLERLGHALERYAARESRFLAVLYMDVDRFKAVNDSLGHLAGDEALVIVANRVRACVRPGDTVARLGGDEFAVLLEALVSPVEADEVARRIQHAMEEPFLVRGQQMFASLSIGIMRTFQPDDTPDSILRGADTAMYRAKRQGRAGTEVFDERHSPAASDRLVLESNLWRAVERNELILHYQPIVRLLDASLVGFEALVRWQHPERGILGPSTFIPMAEESGLIRGIGAWVLREACRQMAEMTTMVADAQDVSVAVNVSSRQFGDPDFPASVERILAETGLRPDRLVIELTETALMEQPTRARRMLERLRTHGIRIHLDDFGVGYSSLSHLRLFPIDRIKIDRVFVTGLPGRREDNAIIRAILALADALGVEVIAEGVESNDQWSHLHELHCAYGQGYYFSKPVGIDRMADVARIGLDRLGGGLSGARAIRTAAARKVRLMPRGRPVAL